ncbi:MAG: GNAT family N-acetyltransferase [Bacillota bacterium]
MAREPSRRNDDHNIVNYQEKYLPELTRIFISAFSEGVEFFTEVEDTRVKTTRPEVDREASSARKKLENAVYDFLKLLGQVYQPGFLVAVDKNDRPQGYIIMIKSIKPLWQEAIKGGHLFYFFRHWLQGHYGLTLFDVGKTIINKIYYITFAVKGTAAAQILALAVSPLAQGDGLGSKLTEAGMDYLKDEGVKRVKLEVRPDNPAAKHIYEKYGFKVVGRAKDLHDEWFVMEADLRENRGGN